MIVWDKEDNIENSKEEVLRWRDYSQEGIFYSIPRYLEENAEHLRAKYIAFIYDLGESYINDKRIIDYLDLDNNFSFWWMNQIAEKSPFKSPRVYDCLRLLALEEILLDKKPLKVTLVSSDTNLFKAIQYLCQNLHIEFNWNKCRNGKKTDILRKFYNLLPYQIRALLNFRFILLRLPLRKLTKPNWFSGTNSVFFCSYFSNLDRELCSKGRFYSRQWEKLPEILNNIGIYSNWIHHFVENPDIPNSQIGLNWIKKFNSDAQNRENHSFLETFITWSVVLKTMKNWLLLNVIYFQLRNVHTVFTPKCSSAWLWPLLIDDWKMSLIGPIALNNCLWFELFDAVFKDLPYQNAGFYLWENQGWEIAMIHAWHKYGHGQIIGVPHATVAFWHLNNFDDPRSLNSSSSDAKPIPDLLAVNGPMAWKAFVDTKYPVERLVEVEALRYQYLHKLSHISQDRQINSKINKRCSKGDNSIKVLILGDFTIAQTRKMLDCFEDALKKITANINVTFKAHPLCAIKVEDYPALSFEITDRPLGEHLQNYDIVFSSNVTSAALDALLAGLYVIVFLDDDFNHSPLRDVDGVKFISSSKELATVINEDNRHITSYSSDNYFWLDDNFPRWRRLLYEKTNS